MQVKQCEAADFLAPILAKEINQPMCGCDIGSYRMYASAPVVGQIASPTRRKRASRMALPF